MRTVIVFATLGMIVFGGICPAGEEDAATRNPFGVADVTDPFGDDAVYFGAQGLGRPSDANAEPWSSFEAGSAGGSIDGEWDGRWSSHQAPRNWWNGSGRIVTKGDRVYILFEANTADFAEEPKRWLIECRREGDWLVGRYQGLSDPKDTSPWRGLIVDGTRIDGIYSLGRWDLRRSRRADGQNGLGQ